MMMMMVETMMMMIFHHLKMAKLMQPSWKKLINTWEENSLGKYISLFFLSTYIYITLNKKCRTSHSTDMNNYFVSLSFFLILQRQISKSTLQKSFFLAIKGIFFSKKGIFFLKKKKKKKKK